MSSEMAVSANPKADAFHQMLCHSSFVRPMRISRKISLAVCCLQKKLKQPTMQSFLKYFKMCGDFDVIPFPEEMILNDTVESWPTVDCIIPFASTGFPLDKAERYAELNPYTYCLTEPASQRVLLDRRAFYQAMKRNNIPMLPYVVCSRDGFGGQPEAVVEESDDYIVVNGQRMDKPFVEKPVDANDHEVIIYRHSSEGGGARCLFRKIENASSAFRSDINSIRRSGSYIYEKFVHALDAVDIKCYTVGPNYVHAEARKSPVVDGVVLRDADGKEVRHVVTLSPPELIASRKIIKVFRQMVCGFDMIRTTEHPQGFCVIDVNGFSFVKCNEEYVVRAGKIMRDIFVEEYRKRGLHRAIREHSSNRELMGVVVVCRHADRTPKQKLKFELRSRHILSKLALSRTATADVTLENDERRHLLSALKPLLENIATDKVYSPQERNVLRAICLVLQTERNALKVQLRPLEWDPASSECVRALMVVKWGGCLTPAGASQAAMFGNHFVQRVFGSEAAAYTGLRQVACTTGSCSRVVDTARILMQQFAHSVVMTTDDTLLNDADQGKTGMKEVMKQVSRILHIRTSADSISDEDRVPGLDALLECPVLDRSERTPFDALCKLNQLVAEVDAFVQGLQTEEEVTFYEGETRELLRDRWQALLQGFWNPAKEFFDVTKIPGIFENVSYDVTYNQEGLAPLDLYPLFTLAEVLASIVACNSFGVNDQQKFRIGSLIAGPLTRRILSDLSEVFSGQGPRTRLYVSSESHLAALRNVLYHNGSATFHSVGEPTLLHFLCHVVFKVYRYAAAGDVNEPSLSNQTGNKFSLDQIEVHFSSGIDHNMFGIVQDHHIEYAAVCPMIRIHNNLSVAEFEEIVALCERERASQRLVDVSADQHHFGPPESS